MYNGAVCNQQTVLYYILINILKKRNQISPVPINIFILFLSIRVGTAYGCTQLILYGTFCKKCTVSLQTKESTLKQRPLQLP